MGGVGVPQCRLDAPVKTREAVLVVDGDTAPGGRDRLEHPRSVPPPRPPALCAWRSGRAPVDIGLTPAGRSFSRAGLLASKGAHRDCRHRFRSTFRCHPTGAADDLRAELFDYDAGHGPDPLRLGSPGPTVDHPVWPTPFDFDEKVLELPLLSSSNYLPETGGDRGFRCEPE